MRRIPFEMQKSLYSHLMTYQTTPVYDDVPSGAKYPFVTFGDFEASPYGAKELDTNQVTITLEVWSKQQGRKEVEDIMNDLCLLIDHSFIPLEKGTVQKQEVVSAIAYKEESLGYHGTLTVVFLILN